MKWRGVGEAHATVQATAQTKASQTKSIARRTRTHSSMPSPPMPAAATQPDSRRNPISVALRSASCIDHILCTHARTRTQANTHARTHVHTHRQRARRESSRRGSLHDKPATATPLLRDNAEGGVPIDVYRQTLSAAEDVQLLDGRRQSHGPGRCAMGWRKEGPRVTACISEFRHLRTLSSDAPGA